MPGMTPRRGAAAAANNCQSWAPRSGQAVMETFIVVLVVGVLLFGLLQTAVVFSGREVLHHAAARAARARAVGFNEWMAFKARSSCASEDNGPAPSFSNSINATTSASNAASAATNLARWCRYAAWVFAPRSVGKPPPWPSPLNRFSRFIAAMRTSPFRMGAVGRFAASTTGTWANCSR